jgi:effector-binding domain-containing protein
MSNYSVEVKTIPSMLVASYKMTIPTNDVVPMYFNKAHHALHDFISDHGLKILGPFISIWHQGPDVMKNEVVEGIFEIDKVVSGTGEVQVYKTSETLVATLIHTGEFEELVLAHQALQEWIEINGYKFNGGYREIYLKNDPEDMSNSETEIQYHVVIR